MITLPDEQAFDVLLKGRKIATVHYPMHSTGPSVRDDLVANEGYDPHIVVIRQKEPK